MSALDFHPPKFDAHSLEIIRDKVARYDFHDLPAPSAEYQRMFCPTPQLVELNANGEYVGLCEDGSRCMVPGAFADYPPDDVQPLWSDVTYLRLQYRPLTTMWRIILFGCSTPSSMMLVLSIKSCGIVWHR